MARPARWLTVPALLVLVLAIPAPASAVSPSGAPSALEPVGTPLTPPVRERPVRAPAMTDRRVVIISDSAMAGVRWHGALGGLRGFRSVPMLESCRRLVMASCRGREGYAPRTAFEEIRQLPVAAPDDVLVIATGYNDSHETFAGDVDWVMAAARERRFRHVAWVTYRSDTDYELPSSSLVRFARYKEMNRILRARFLSGRYPEMQLWDLDRYTMAAPQWFLADGVHQSRLGAWAVADWLSRHVAAMDRRQCPMPWTISGTRPRPCPLPDPLPAVIGPPDIAALYGLTGDLTGRPQPGPRLG
jgi:hypothetical protein